MKSIYLLLLLFAIVSSKSIEDPVARHDANQCGTYLCSSIPTYATQYLQSGCQGQFIDFIKSQEELFNKELKSNMEMYENSEKVVDQNGVNQNIVIILGILSGFFSLTVGYIYGKKENEDNHFYFD
jgi:hypothetical protein